MTDLPPIERLQALRLEPGDTLVVSLPERYDFDLEQVENWREMFREALGDHPILFTQGEIDLSVVKEAS